MNLRKSISMHGLVLNIAGALLVLAGIGLVAMTARGLLNYRAAAGRHGGEVIDLGTHAQPQAGQHGYMARVVGIPQVVEAPHDPEFNLRVNTPVLVRHVEMFQWREIRIGDSVHYEMDWVDRPLDSSHFEDPRGHANPASFPISGKQFDAGLVQMGGFKLGPLLQHALPGSEQVAPDPKSLPENLAASFTLYQNHLVTSARPDDPRLGDLRVSWDEVPLQQLTIVGRLDGDRLVAAAEAASWSAVNQLARAIRDGHDSDSASAQAGGASDRRRGGGTWPGAEPVSKDEELARVLPVIATIRAHWDGPISIDTAKAAVAHEAVAAGATIWNDVSALSGFGSPEMAAALGCEVVLMHMQGEPRTMQAEPHYDDVAAEVAQFLARRAEAAMAAGVARGKIWLDPGIGFGKHMIRHNLPLLARLETIVALGFPVLLGLSRKSFISAVDGGGRSADERLGGSIAGALWGAKAGVAGLRVHDVRETVQALRVWQAIEAARP